MEKHETDMVIAILDMFRNNGVAERDNVAQMLMLAMANNKIKDKEKVPEVNVYERSMAE